MVAQNVSLSAGEILLTSGLGGNFPTDVLVGQVLEITRSDNQLFQSASVQPVVDFNAIRAVLVIANFREVNITPLIPTPGS
jgi:rod shape-determining protein MreC